MKTKISLLVLLGLSFVLYPSFAQPAGTIPPEQRDQLRRQQAAQQGPAFPAMPARRVDPLRNTDPAFFATDEALQMQLVYGVCVGFCHN